MKVIVALILASAVAGCAEKPVRTEQTTNTDISVGLLFEKDGYAVYRFYDCGEPRYYVVPSGRVVWDHNTSNGKGAVMHHQREVDTAGDRSDK